MRQSAIRNVVSYVLLLCFPGFLLAADTNAAMLYTSGTAWINGAHIPRSSAAIFTGDLLQTPSDSVANINLPGSTITVLADSLVQFEGNALDLQHGALTVSTSRGIAATAGDIKIAPVSNVWTEFNVTDVDGTVRVAARKGDLTISDGKQTVTLAQGQETSRDDSSDSSSEQNGKKRNRKRGTGAVPAAGGGILNSPIAVGVGAAAIAGVTTWVLLQSDNPASPTKP
jgi:hypothetical protein